MRIVPLVALIAAVASSSPAVSAIASMSAGGDVMPDRSTILIARVDVPDDGIVAVRAVVDGRIRRTPIAQVAVKKGLTTNIRFALGRPAGDGQIFVVSLHADMNRDGAWDTGDTVVTELDVYAATATRSARAE